jgi:hypothetical protein
VLAALLLVAGCHSALPRLDARGEYDEVIRRAQKSIFAPRRKAARAYAHALVQRGQTMQAMDVLMKDFRRGGQIESLVALADLEREYGWDGLSAHHYTRVITLDRKTLRGRADVCDLLRERARVYLAAGEGEAADLDVRRVRFLCPESTRAGTAAADRRLAAEADAAADALVKARISGTKCREKNCVETRTSDRIAAVERELAEATAAGVKELADASERHGASVSPKDLSRLLLADLRGELGSDPVLDDTIQRWVGEQTWSDLAPDVMSQDTVIAGYVQLRLTNIVSDLPSGSEGRRGSTEAERWADRALEIPGARPWRLFAWRGDVAAAELELSSRWRPREGGAGEDRGARERSAGESAEPSTTPEPTAPSHWSARSEMSAESLPELLVIARLRRASGHDDLALELTRWNLRRAHEAAVPDVAAWTTDEALRALAWGRPWHALAIADAIDVADLAPVRAAAASSIALARALCGGTCRDDEDLGTVTRVLGEAWVQARAAELHALALGNRSRAAATEGCPTPAEVLARDAVGPLAEAIADVRTRAGRDEPGRGDALAGAIAADLGPWCAARFALPVMADAGYEVAAGRLADALAHVPEMRAARDVLVHAQLALVGRQHDRAEQLAIRAAGMSDAPREIWTRVARFAHATGDRDLELLGWREAMMHAPSLHADGARRALLLHALRDFSRSWAAARDVGREAITRDVQAYLAGFAPAARWQQREALVAAILADGLLDAPVQARMPEGTDVRAEVLGAVLPQADHAKVHARAMAKIRGEDPGAKWSDLHADGLAEDAKRGRVRTIPKTTEIFANPAELEDVRLALAEHARDWQVRWRLAIGLAVYGAPRARVLAAAQLREMASEGDAAVRLAVDDLLVHAPAAMEPAGSGASATAVVDDPDLLLRLLLGLDLAPALVGR